MSFSQNLRNRVGVWAAPWLLLFLGSGCVTSSVDQGGGDSPVGPVRGVLLDPGHGGEPEEAAARSGERFAGLGKAARQGYREECYGAISASGYPEKTATLAVAKKVKALLEKAGIATAMTRSSDRYTPLNERVAKALQPEYRDWLFVSIHFNRSSAKQQASGLKAKDRAPRGFEIYVLPARGARSSMGKRPPPGYLTANNTRSGNNLLAESIQSRLSAIPEMQNRGIKEAWFVVLRGSPMPSVLIEAGFLSNPEEGSRIATDSYQNTLAQAIANGIQGYQARTSTFAQRAAAGSKTPRFAMSDPVLLRE